MTRTLSDHQAGLIEVALRHWAASETHHGRAPAEDTSNEARALADELCRSEFVCLGQTDDTDEASSPA